MEFDGWFKRHIPHAEFPRDNDSIEWHIRNSTKEAWQASREKIISEIRGMNVNEVAKGRHRADVAHTIREIADRLKGE